MKIWEVITRPVNVVVGLVVALISLVAVVNGPEVAREIVLEAAKIALNAILIGLATIVATLVAKEINWWIDRTTARPAKLIASSEVGWSDSPPKDGVMHAQGEPVTGLHKLEALAEQGDAQVRFKLGEIYRRGDGVPQDYETALKWYTLAAEQKLAEAQNNLGFIYAEGTGVPQDDETALKWFRYAAEQGYAGARYNLGVMYAKGRGVPQDDEIALKWFRCAAEQGHAGAQHNLGFMYYQGIGVPQHYVDAYMWLNMAASSGDKGAPKNRDTAAKRMTPSQLENAQDLARECYRKKCKGC